MHGLSSELQALLEEASASPRPEDLDDIHEGDAEESRGIWIAAACSGPTTKTVGMRVGQGAGYVYLGNLLAAPTTFVVTGRKSGRPVQETYRVRPFAGYWREGWDTGGKDQLIVQARGELFPVSPFWGGVSAVWCYRE